MCGLFGSISKTQLNLKTMLSSLGRLSHRGPDRQSYKCLKYGDNHLFLGHQRLALVDLNPRSDQPFSYRNLTILFNGEIYNYKQLRSVLVKHGYVFETEGDTEVLLKSWHLWGEECLDRLNGMFAFCIFDTATGEVFLARDRAGVKPLYFCCNEVSFSFASELRSFQQKAQGRININVSAVEEYLSQGYCFGIETIISGVFRLKKGSLLRFNLMDFSYRIGEYWRPVKSGMISIESEAKLENEDQFTSSFTDILKDSVALRLEADRPVGVFLSGGYDSAITTALAASIRPDITTYTIGFEDCKFDESSHARCVAEHLKVKNRTLIMSDSDVKKQFERLPQVWDEPISDTSCIPMLALSEFSRQEVVGVLSADGADELFLGYNKYWRLHKLIELHSRVPGASLAVASLDSLFNAIESANVNVSHKHSGMFLRKARTVVNALRGRNVGEQLLGYQSIFSQQEIKDILIGDHGYTSLSLGSPSPQVRDDFTEMQLTDFETYLPENILKKVDRATMSVGLEARDPFLDYRLFDLALSPAHSSLLRMSPKRVVKSAAHALIPKELLDRPKQGFSSPIESWMFRLMQDEMSYYFSDSYLKGQTLIDSKMVKGYYKRFISGDRSVSRKMWTLLILFVWLDEWTT